MISVLVTGFGPFPGAPFNPTGPLVRRLARLRRPALDDVRLVTHMFPTSYGAVDRELPALMERHRPDVLLMFGLATRTPFVRIETRARNALSAHPDASGSRPSRFAIVPGGDRARPLRIKPALLLATARPAGVPVRLSRDAGHYLCNYLCWRALEAAERPGGPKIAAFVHVPKVPRTRAPASRPSPVAMDGLVRLGGMLLMALIAQARRT